MFNKWIFAANGLKRARTHLYGPLGFFYIGAHQSGGGSGSSRRAADANLLLTLNISVKERFAKFHFL